MFLMFQFCGAYNAFKSTMRYKNQLLNPFHTRWRVWNGATEKIQDWNVTWTLSILSEAALDSPGQELSPGEDRLADLSRDTEFRHASFVLRNFRANISTLRSVGVFRSLSLSLSSCIGLCVLRKQTNQCRCLNSLSLSPSFSPFLLYARAFLVSKQPWKKFYFILCVTFLFSFCIVVYISSRIYSGYKAICTHYMLAHVSFHLYTSYLELTIINLLSFNGTFARLRKLNTLEMKRRIQEENVSLGNKYFS